MESEGDEGGKKKEKGDLHLSRLNKIIKKELDKQVRLQI